MSFGSGRGRWRSHVRSLTPAGPARWQNGRVPVEPAKTRRPRGRPPRADGAATAERLVDAASSVCAEYGYDGSTVSLIAERADVHPTAIYNHFDVSESVGFVLEEVVGDFEDA